MNQPRNFYDWFISTDELELCRALSNESYREPGTLPESDLALLASNLPSMDEGHAASAVNILAHHAPRRLLPLMAELLSDVRVGVWCAAERAMLLLHEQGVEISRRMLDEFQAAIARRPGEPTDSWALRQLADRIRQKVN